MAGTLPPPPVLFRSITVDLARSKDEDTFHATLSTEAPVNMGYAIEILDHRREAVDLGRAKDGLPLLLDHDPTKVVGRAENVRLEGGCLRATLRFGRSQLARDVREDVAAGIRREMSIGYTVEAREPVDRQTVRATRWTPYETSVVGIPADPGAGVGRAHDLQRNTLMTTSAPSGAQSAEAEEIMAIGNLVQQPDMARRAVAEGLTIAQFRERLRSALPPNRPVATVGDAGIGDRELRQFSAARMIQALAHPNDRALADAAGFEFEVSRTIAQRSGRQVQGSCVPLAALFGTRSVLTTSGGGSIVANNHLAGEFVEPLRSSLMVGVMGARMLDDLTGDVSIPKQNAVVTASWISENASSPPPASNPGFGTIIMSPKQVTANSSYTLLLLRQSAPMVEGIVLSDLRRAVSEAIDYAALFGTGTSNQPHGVFNAPGVQTNPIGENGGAPTWADVVYLAAEVEHANAAEEGAALGYLTNSRVKAKLMVTEKAAGTARYILEEPGDRLAGYRFGVSNQVRHDFSKGSGSNLSGMVFGAWNNLMIGMWGAVELIVDPYTESKRGNVNVTIHAFVDTAIRHASAFRLMTDIATAP